MSRRIRLEQDGYVALPSFLDAGEVTACLRELDRYIGKVVPSLPPEHAFAQDAYRRELAEQQNGGI